MLLVIDENKVVFINKILHAEKDGCKEWNEWHQSAEKQAIQEDHQTIRLVVPKVELVIINVGSFDGKIFLAPVVSPLSKPSHDSVRSINETKCVGHESELNDELQDLILLAHQVVGQESRPVQDVCLFELLEENHSRTCFTDWDQDCIQEHEEIDPSYNSLLNCAFPLVIFMLHGKVNDSWNYHKVDEDRHKRSKVPDGERNYARKWVGLLFYCVKKRKRVRWSKQQQ